MSETLLLVTYEAASKPYCVSCTTTCETGVCRLCLCCKGTVCTRGRWTASYQKLGLEAWVHVFSEGVYTHAYVHTNTHTYTHTCHTPHTLTSTLLFVNASGINLENAVTRWKWGVVRLITESTKTPIVIPLWHVGMEDILPTRSPYIPQLFKVRVVRLMQLSLCTTAGGQDCSYAGP